MSHQWVRVEFYGALPPGQAITDDNELEIARNLMTTFGFVAIDGLRAATVPQPSRTPRSPGSETATECLAREASSRASERTRAVKPPSTVRGWLSG